MHTLLLGWLPTDENRPDESESEDSKEKKLTNSPVGYKNSVVV